MNKSLLTPVCLFFAVCLFFLCLFQPFGVVRSASTHDLEIEKGMSFDEIADTLRAEKLIWSKTFFKIFGLISGQARQVKPGRYVLSSNLSFFELIRILTRGPAGTPAIISPGMTLKEIDEKLSALTVIKPNELVNFDVDSLKNDYPWLEGNQSLEGFLFPDTYEFFLGSDADSVVREFLDNFQLKVLPFFENKDNLSETINLASLLEKEIPDYDESRLVAGILTKRLSVGMPLQVDASLIYGKCSGKFLDCPALQKEDYKLDSYYNTYLYGGLPETPICNPGLNSIKAALNPEKSDYWYYLSDPKTKKTIFSKTLDEHNKNRNKYLLNRQ